MAICGLNLDISSLQGEITTQISGFLDLESSLITPGGAASYLSSLESGLATLKSKVDTLIPDIPFSTSGLTSLRDELASYVSVPSISGLADITSKFGDLTSLTGYADINLSDLASSAFSLGASFDPCSLAGDLKIPNIVADASGALQALAIEAPDIGNTVESITNIIEDQTITDKLAEVIKDNEVIVSTLSADEADLVISGNISTAITGMGDVIKKLPSGEEMVETKDAFVAEVKERTAVLTESITTYKLNEKVEKLISASGPLPLNDYRLARRAGYRKFRSENPTLKVSAAFKSFQAKIDSGAIDLADFYKTGQDVKYDPPAPAKPTFGRSRASFFRADDF